MCVFQKRSKPFPFWCNAPLRRRVGPGRRTSWTLPSPHELFVCRVPAVMEASGPVRRLESGTGWAVHVTRTVLTVLNHPPEKEEMHHDGERFR